MKLSERILDRRTDRLDEWSMDELSRDAAAIEALNAELLEALESMVNMDDMNMAPTDEHIAKAKSLIAKAKGEKQ